MKIAAGCTRRMANSAIRFARTRFLRAVTKYSSLASRSFHQPICAEKVAVMKISLTGV
jgi:hypothetical protein